MMKSRKTPKITVLVNMHSVFTHVYWLRELALRSNAIFLRSWAVDEKKDEASGQWIEVSAPE